MPVMSPGRSATGNNDGRQGGANGDMRKMRWVKLQRGKDPDQTGHDDNATTNTE